MIAFTGWPRSASFPSCLVRFAWVLAKLVPGLLIILATAILSFFFAIQTSPQQVDVSGQIVNVGAAPPSFSLESPARMVQVNNQVMFLNNTRFYGLYHPQLSMEPLVFSSEATALLDPKTSRQTEQADARTFSQGFASWFLQSWIRESIAALILAIVLSWVAAYRRIARHGKRELRGRHQISLLATVQSCRWRIVRRAGAAFLISALLWGAQGVFDLNGAAGLNQDQTLSAMVGTAYIPTPVAGPRIRTQGVYGITIGNSIFATDGNPYVPGATAADKVCERSDDSPAVELGISLGEKWVNLACSSATIANGLRGPQDAHGISIPAQISELERYSGEKAVVVAIGQDDLNWSTIVRYCYSVKNCDDNMLHGQFIYEMGQLQQQLGFMGADLANLPGSPQILLQLSYDIFDPNDFAKNCPDMHPPGHVGLDASKLALFSYLNSQLNEALLQVAKQYHFTVVRPNLTPLCTLQTDGLGPDIQGIHDEAPFHPTPLGVERIVAAIAAQLN